MVTKNEYLHNVRHSAAHILAQAVTQLFPGTKMTIGPVTETGFFYDFLPTTNFKEEDLAHIEQRMHELVKKNYAITGSQVPKADARKLFADNPFKLEIIDQIEGETVGIYYQGEFFDLCRGGHVDAIGEVQHFKLTGISGSYWRADRDGVALQRISGIAFATREDFDAHLKAIEEAALYDHRRLGKQLELFSFHDEAPGLAFFHAKGFALYNRLIEFMRSVRGSLFQEIRTPFIMDESLWKTSGHYDFYKKNMYFTQVDDGMFCLKPMNCPGASMLFRERPHSYRELPMRIAEFGYVHRHELSGVLHGLFRVRGFTIDDAHIYCTLDQLQNEIILVLKLAQRVYTAFNFATINIAVSTRPEQAMGSDEDWARATAALTNALDTLGLSYIIQEGEGAFYGPKIEIKVEDAMGRRWQCGTVQVDFNMPINFDLTYVAADQSRQRPVMVHQAIYGSIERFLGIILEHSKGRLPIWLTPIQARVLTITDKQRDYATDVVNKLQAAGVRAELDLSHDQISAQIRRAQTDKIPYMLVIGGKEAEAGVVTLRDAEGKQQPNMSIDACIELITSFKV